MDTLIILHQSLADAAGSEKYRKALAKKKKYEIIPLYR